MIASVRRPAMPAHEHGSSEALIAGTLRDWQRALADRLGCVGPYLPRQRPDAARGVPATASPPQPVVPTNPTWADPARSEYQWLRQQLELAREMRMSLELQARSLRLAGAPNSERSGLERSVVQALGREAGIQSRLAGSAEALGRPSEAARASRASEGLQTRMHALEADIADGPLRDVLNQARNWEDQLGARLELLSALRAPEEDVLRLSGERIEALQRESDALRALGLTAKADRVDAQALRLAAGAGRTREREEDPLDRRLREVIGADPRNADRVTPLAVARAEAASANMPVDVREDSAGMDRRVVVELRAPRDLGNAALDAMVNEVVTRVVDALRSHR
jgi:hypothetical protein